MMPVYKCEKCGKVHQDESQCGLAPVRCPKCGTKALWLDEPNMMTCANMDCDCDKFTAPEWARTANARNQGLAPQGETNGK